VRTAALCLLSAILAAGVTAWLFQRGLGTVRVIAEDNQASVWARQLAWGLDTAAMPEVSRAPELANRLNQSIKGSFLALESFGTCHSPEVCARVEQELSRARKYAAERGLSLAAE
jgi:hypothetical protein